MPPGPRRLAARGRAARSQSVRSRAARRERRQRAGSRGRSRARRSRHSERVAIAHARRLRRAAIPRAHAQSRTPPCAHARGRVRQPGDSSRRSGGPRYVALRRARPSATRVLASTRAAHALELERSGRSHALANRVRGRLRSVRARPAFTVRAVATAPRDGSLGGERCSGDTRRMRSGVARSSARDGVPASRSQPRSRRPCAAPNSIATDGRPRSRCRSQAAARQQVAPGSAEPRPAGPRLEMVGSPKNSCSVSTRARVLGWPRERVSRCRSGACPRRRPGAERGDSRAPADVRGRASPFRRPFVPTAGGPARTDL